MRYVFLCSVAMLASPLAAQDHSAHQQGGHAQHEAGNATPKVDHCAMGHLPPEQCPPKNEHAGHGGVDHSDMDHSGDHSGNDTVDHSAMDHSGHGAKAPSGQTGHAAMDHGSMDNGSMAHGSMAHGSMDHGSMDHSGHGAVTDKSVPGAAPEDAVPARAFEGPRHAADAIWGAQKMAPSRENLARENGGMRTGSVLVERLEARFAADGGEDGYVWDAQAFYGGDVSRFVVKTEGEGELGGALENAEIQALYSRAIGPFFDLQAGVRFDLEPDTRGHLVLGVQGLSPYMFHVDGAVFLSDKGDITARIEGEYDQRLTQRFILQPRIEVELAAQDISERGIGAGISKIEPGVRLRYEIVPEFAPYFGIEYEAALGETAEIARAAGEDPDGFKFLIGVRAWF